MQGDSGLAALRAEPVGRGRDRRASLVIKETKQLLTGLHEDADRSEALMAELEALLAAAQHASGQLPDAANAPPILQFAAVQPMQIEGSTQDGSCVEDDTSVRAPRTPITQTVSEKRRSSIVTFDGSKLSGAGTGAASPALPGCASLGSGVQANRSMSFSRPRAASLQAARSFSECRSNGTLRRNALTDVGIGANSAAQSQQQQQQQQGQYMASLIIIPGRRSSMDSPELVHNNARRSIGANYSSAPTTMSYGQVTLGRASRDESADGGTDVLWMGSPGTGSGSTFGHMGGGAGEGASSPAPATSGGGGAAGGSGVLGTSGSGSSRFLKMLKGIFHSHSSGETSMPNPSSPTITTVTTTATTTTTANMQSASVATSSLEGALAHGALSSMTMCTPSRGQMARASIGGSSFSSVDSRRTSGTTGFVALGVVGASTGGSGAQHRISGTPSPPPPALLIGCSPSSSSGSHSPHALVPTPPSTRPHHREASVNGVMQPLSGVTSPLLLSPTGLSSTATATTTACIGPASANAILNAAVSSSTVDYRTNGVISSSRRSLNLPITPVGLRGQM